MRNLLFMLVVVTPAVACAETLKGAVTDSSDAPISDALVVIHWDSAGSTVGLKDNIGIKSDLALRAKEDGTFIVDLPPGFYDVCAFSPAFSPVCRKARIKYGTAAETALLMETDPLYTSEMGNRVEAIPSLSQVSSISHFVQPSYPALARQAGISGQATLTIEVNREGSVTAIHEGRSTHPLLAQEAKQCAKSWSFAPNVRERSVSVTIYFGFAGAPTEIIPKATVTTDFAASSVRVYVTSSPAPMVRQ